MTDSEGIIQPPPVLQLPALDVAQIHPHALERYVAFCKELMAEVPPDELSDGDLSDSEMSDFKKYITSILEWLERCNMDAGDAALSVYPYSTAVIHDMCDLKALMKTAYERKVEKARRETEEKERQAALEAEKKRRLAALKKVDPPLDDGEEYLSEEEHQEFLRSLPGAIDGYLGRDKRVESYSPGIWLLNSRAWDYGYWTSVIKERKEKEARKKQAQIEYDQYLDRLSLAVEELKGQLAKSKKPKLVYPTGLEQYEPDSWCELDLPGKQQVQEWAESQIIEMLPEILVPVTQWQLSWQVHVLPEATYEVVDIPCVRLCFESHILITANLELKGCTIRKRRPGGHTVDVPAEGEKLGTLYLEADSWLTPGSFIIPIALLNLLASGELEAPGITVTEHSFPFTTFSVQGFEGDVEIYDNFRSFIETIATKKPLVKVLLDMKIIDIDTAKLVEAKWEEPLPVTVKVTTGGGPAQEEVVAKLMELGWSEMEAKSAVGKMTIPVNVTTEDIVKTILEKSNG